MIQFVLVLSRGKAAVERSFSVNSDILLPNMKTDVPEAVKTLAINIYEYKVPDDMLKYCSQARAKYSMQMDAVKAEKAKVPVKRNRAAVEDKFTDARKKLKLLEEAAYVCLKEADKKANESLKKHAFKLLAQSVSLREKDNLMLDKDVKEQSNIVQELKSRLN